MKRSKIIAQNFEEYLVDIVSMQERRQISKAPLSKYYGDDNNYDNDYY